MAKKAEFRMIGLDDVVKLAKIREAKKGETGYSVQTADGVKKFVMDANDKNRPFKLKLAEQYSEGMLGSGWDAESNGESWIIGSDNKIISCAHRCFALFIAEHMRQYLYSIDAQEKISELGLSKKPIKIEALVVTGVKPKHADTADTGRSRTLADILFRRREFKGKEINDSTLSTLSRELAVALRLVWLRTEGNRVARGPKLHHPEALDFLEKNPLLHDAVLHVWEENGGNGADGKKINSLISLGYAAGLMYLMAYSGTDRKKYGDGELDMTRKPKNWAKAETFWTLFAQDLHDKDNPIKALHKVLTNNRLSDDKYDRDTLCTIVTRSWLAEQGEADGKWSTTRALSSSLFTKEDDRLVLNFERFGGIDLDRDALVELGIISEEVVARKSVDNWKIGDTAWVDQRDEGVDPWFGTIEEFSDDGKVVKVFSKDDEDSYSVSVEWLCEEEPESEEEETEEEETVTA